MEGARAMRRPYFTAANHLVQPVVCQRHMWLLKKVCLFHKICDNIFCFKFPTFVWFCCNDRPYFLGKRIELKGTIKDPWSHGTKGGGGVNLAGSVDTVMQATQAEVLHV
jgi:hypothetical protein